METNKTLKELIKELVGPPPIQARLAEVVSVELNTRTCTVKPQDGGPQLEGVKLLAGETQSATEVGTVHEPAEGSLVVIGRIENQPNYYVAAFTELANVWVYTTGQVQMKGASDGVQLNDGQFGGMVKVQDLVSKLNRLENAVNKLVGEFNAHTHLVAALPAPGTPPPTIPTLVPAAPSTSTIAPLTLKSDLENPKATH